MIKQMSKFIFILLSTLGILFSKAYTNHCYNLFKGEKIQKLQKIDSTKDSFQTLGEQKLLETYRYKGDINLSDGNYKKAIEYYDKLIELDPKNKLTYLYYLHRGIAKSELGEQEEALVDINKAIDLNPQYAQSYQTKGIVKEILKLNDEAIDSYIKAIELSPNFFEAHRNLAVLYSESGEYQKSINHFQAIQNYPEDPYIYYNKGVTLFNIGLYEEALINVNKAIRLKPDFKEALSLKEDFSDDVIKKVKEIEVDNLKVIQNQIETSNKKNFFRKRERYKNYRKKKLNSKSGKKRGNFY